MSIIFMKRKEFFSSFLSLVKIGEKYSFDYKPSCENYIKCVHSKCDNLTSSTENFFMYYDDIHNTRCCLRINKIVKFIINDDTYILINY